MSVFKRLSNVAKGTIKDLANNLGELDPFGDTPDPARETRAPPAPAAPDQKKGDKRAMLERLLAEGLLSQQEFDEKLATLSPEERGDPPGSAPRKPMKRTL